MSKRKAQLTEENETVDTIDDLTSTKKKRSKKTVGLLLNNDETSLNTIANGGTHTDVKKYKTRSSTQTGDASTTKKSRAGSKTETARTPKSPWRRVDGKRLDRIIRSPYTPLANADAEDKLIAISNIADAHTAYMDMLVSDTPDLEVMDTENYLATQGTPPASNNSACFPPSITIVTTAPTPYMTPYTSVASPTGDDAHTPSSVNSWTASVSKISPQSISTPFAHSSSINYHATPFLANGPTVGTPYVASSSVSMNKLKDAQTSCATQPTTTKPAFTASTKLSSPEVCVNQIQVLEEENEVIDDFASIEATRHRRWSFKSILALMLIIGAACVVIEDLVYDRAHLRTASLHLNDLWLQQSPSHTIASADAGDLMSTGGFYVLPTPSTPTTIAHEKVDNQETAINKEDIHSNSNIVAKSEVPVAPVAVTAQVTEILEQQSSLQLHEHPVKSESVRAPEMPQSKATSAETATITTTRTPQEIAVGTTGDGGVPPLTAIATPKVQVSASDAVAAANAKVQQLLNRHQPLPSQQQQQQQQQSPPQTADPIQATVEPVHTPAQSPVRLNFKRTQFPVGVEAALNSHNIQQQAQQPAQEQQAQQQQQHVDAPATQESLEARQQLQKERQADAAAASVSRQKVMLQRAEAHRRSIKEQMDALQRRR